MESWKVLLMVVCLLIAGGCSDLAAAKFLLPETFGFTEIDDGIYIESGSD